MKSTTNQSNKSYRPISLIAADLALLESDVLKMLKKEVTFFRYDQLNRPCVDVKYVGILAENADYENARCRALRAEGISRSDGSAEYRDFLKQQRKALIDKYLSHIEHLQRLHANCLSQ